MWHNIRDDFIVTNLQSGPNRPTVCFFGSVYTLQVENNVSIRLGYRPCLEQHDASIGGVSMTWM